jgi:hypothetical protein
MRHPIVFAVVGCSVLGAGLWFGVTSLLRPDVNHRELGDFGGVVEVPRPIYPLKLSENARFLVDQKGTPVLIVGDTAWSLIAQLNFEDIDRYLADREKKGFNSIIVNLIEHKFCTDPPNNKSGLAPFITSGDFRTPNPSYFDFAHEVVKRAGDRGLIVWLAPAYLGYQGGAEGWFQDIKRGGKDSLRAYGRYVGKRFRDLPKIVWIVGGDFTPPVEDLWTVSELAEGIRESDDVHLMTVHGSPGNPVAEQFGHVTWLDINNVYSYDKLLFNPLSNEYRRHPIRPFVLIESTYENEHNSTAADLRRQAYWAMLSGACGQFMGNSPLWHFDGPGVFKQTIPWQKALDQQASWDMVRWRNVFVTRPWQLLVPDDEHSFVVAGRGENESAIRSARTADGKLALVYIPSTGRGAREFTLNLAGLSGPVTARWYNPSNGRHIAIDGGALNYRGSQALKTPGDNGSRENDCLLILETDK